MFNTVDDVILQEQNKNLTIVTSIDFRSTYALNVLEKHAENIQNFYKLRMMTSQLKKIIRVDETHHF